MESFYGETETIAAPHLEKLRSGNIKLTPQENSEFATFVALMRTRTRSYREQVNAIASQMHVLIEETLGTTGGVEELIESNVSLGGERLEVEQLRSALQPWSTAMWSSSKAAKHGPSNRRSRVRTSSTSSSSQ
jgi:hypothetical protein